MASFVAATNVFLVVLLQCLTVSKCQVEEPYLLWSNAGCYSSWCQLGWYSSPAYMTHFDNESKVILISSSYSVYGIDAESGDTLWTVEDSDTRTWPSVIYIEDFFDETEDDTEAIIVGKSDSKILILDKYGTELSSLSEDSSYEFRSITVGKIMSADPGRYYIIAGQTGDGVNTFVYNQNLDLINDWPQRQDSTDGSSWGVYNDNGAVADLTGDGIDDVLMPSDVTTVCAYEGDATPINTTSRYVDSDDNVKVWGAVGVWVNESYDIQGWGPCGSTDAEPYRPNFANSPASTFQFEGETVVVVAGNVYDCSTSPYTDKYYTPFVFHSDRTRYTNDALGIDWLNVPQWTGDIYSMDYSVIENVNPAVAIGDIDGDGYPEFVFSSYDGAIHCFSFLTTAEPYNWPYSVKKGSESFYRYATEPLIVDLDNDGYAEIIVATWAETAESAIGQILVLSYDGTLLWAVDLPDALSTSLTRNGALATPTIGNFILSDDDLELAVQTIYSGLVLYKMPNTANANIIWGTGRGNLRRDGRSMTESYDGSSNTAEPATDAPDPDGTQPDETQTSPPEGTDDSATLSVRFLLISVLSFCILRL